MTRQPVAKAAVWFLGVRPQVHRASKIASYPKGVRAIGSA